jgi:drug/metabolite transporter (DMT)-like permease
MIFLGDKVKVRVWLLLLTGLVGLLFLMYVREGESYFLRVDIWTIFALAGAVLGGFALVCVKSLTKTDSNYTIYLSQCLMGFWIVVVPANLTPLKLDIVGVGILLVIGLAAAAAQLLMNWSFGKLTLSTGSLLGYVTPVCNVFIGLALFGESLGIYEIVGVCLVLLSCIGIVVSDTRS